ncbi:MAG: ABC transporter permease [Thermomicrobiales bacterium]|nr:ABC transporter permease [Thermomicrobiales bacterium]
MSASSAQLQQAAVLAERQAPPRSPARMAFDRLKRSRLAMIGLVIFGVMVILALLSPWIAPYDPKRPDLFNLKASPGADHWLGTDALGRDVLSRLLVGGRYSLGIGVAAALISSLLGLVAGAIAGFQGGVIDGVLMRFVDLMLAFPSIFLLLIIASMLEGISVAGIILFLGLFSWMWLARLVRGEFLSLKRREFAEAARAIGAPGWHIMVRHLLPNAIGVIIVSFTLDIALFMLAEASLSFLGFGVKSGTPTWGNMLSDARTDYLTNPMLAIIPGLTLTIAVLAINFVGDGLRDAFDPRGRAAGRAGK